MFRLRDTRDMNVVAIAAQQKDQNKKSSLLVVWKDGAGVLGANWGVQQLLSFFGQAISAAKR